MKSKLLLIGLSILLLPTILSTSYYYTLEDESVTFYKLVDTSNPDIKIAQPYFIYDEILQQCRYPTQEELIEGHYIPQIPLS
ncbi:hypothetical protein M1146_08240 [Patescibacteria group bacterium]|nr:hypothetical protein [Patescibacteria group bacterium]